MKSNKSREEVPQEEEDNLNESSGKDEEMYSWDELEYKANYVRFISNKSTEKQVQIASAVVNKLEEPVYDHRTRIKERSRPLQKCNDNQPISVFWEIGGVVKSGFSGIFPIFFTIFYSPPVLILFLSHFCYFSVTHFTPCHP